MNVGALVKITDNQDGIQNRVGLVVDSVPGSSEVVVELVSDKTLWIYFPNQVEVIDEG